MAQYIDVHCHVTGDDYDEVGGIAQVLARARENGVSHIVCSGYDLQSSTEAKTLAEHHENVYFSAGFHPSELHKYNDGDWTALKTLCTHEKCVAVGEIGLDYHFENNPHPNTQREFFIKQLLLADELGLPVVIHSRDAAQETLRLLQEHKDLLKKGGLMHCYSYSAEMTESFLSLGLYFSFGGPCTFKNARKVQESVERIPAHRLLSETDCPYLTPVPYRGVFPNEPKNVVHVVKTLATIQGTDEETMQRQIFENAKTLFFKIK